MPLFHFNVYDGISTHDREGTTLVDVHEARREALRRASGLLDEEVIRGRLGEDWRMEITNEEGRMLFRLDLIFDESTPWEVNP